MCPAPIALLWCYIWCVPSPASRISRCSSEFAKPVFLFAVSTELAQLFWSHSSLSVLGLPAAHHGCSIGAFMAGRESVAIQQQRQFYCKCFLPRHYCSQSHLLPRHICPSNMVTPTGCHHNLITPLPVVLVASMPQRMVMERNQERSSIV